MTIFILGIIRKPVALLRIQVGEFNRMLSSKFSCCYGRNKKIESQIKQNIDAGERNSIQMGKIRSNKNGVEVPSISLNEHQYFPNNNEEEYKYFNDSKNLNIKRRNITILMLLSKNTNLRFIQGSLKDFSCASELFDEIKLLDEAQIQEVADYIKNPKLENIDKYELLKRIVSNVK